MKPGQKTAHWDQGFSWAQKVGGSNQDRNSTRGARPRQQECFPRLEIYLCSLAAVTWREGLACVSSPISLPSSFCSEQCYCSHQKANLSYAEHPNYITFQDESCYCWGWRAEHTARTENSVALSRGSGEFSLLKSSHTNWEAWHSHHKGNGN